MSGNSYNSYKYKTSFLMITIQDKGKGQLEQG